MKNFINSLLGKFDICLVRKSSYKKLVSNSSKFRDYEFSEIIDKKYLTKYFENLQESKSQLKQDLFALSELGFKENGFFVEFGATNGIDLSNSYLLEKNFGWSGILAEPAKLWHSELRKNRSGSIETDCVWRESGEILTFNEVNDNKHYGELSTIESFSSTDLHSESRKQFSNKYEVKTISLVDMLKKHSAPRKIDYLSIDTEGSEYEILKAFDFNEYDIRVITCEHNYTPLREKIFALLSKNGYVRKHSEFSLFDDWYVRE